VFVCILGTRLDRASDELAAATLASLYWRDQFQGEILRLNGVEAIKSVAGWTKDVSLAGKLFRVMEDSANHKGQDVPHPPAAVSQ